MRLAVLLAFVLASTVSIRAQKIVAENPDAILITKYTESAIQDSIFVFYDFTTRSDDYNGNLKVEVPSGDWKYQWKYYDYATSDFREFEIVNKYADTTASIDSLSTGFYRLQLTNNVTAKDTLLYAWVFINDSNKGLYVNTNGRSNCNFMTIDVKSKVFKEFVYYDIKAGEPDKLVFTNGAKQFQWEYDKDIDPNIEKEDSLKCLGTRMPFENILIKYNVTDSFGKKDYSEVKYLAIAAKADFEFDPETGEAPLTVKFTPDSKNAFNYEWWAIDPKKDTAVFAENDEEFEHTFDRPGDYIFKLKVWNTSCKDSAGFGISDDLEPFTLTIDSVVFELPNALVLNSSKNGNFKLMECEEDHNKSIRDIEFKIFTREGRLVHEYSGLYSDWTGWTGKRRNSNVDVTSGIYLYVVRIVGYDDFVRKKHGFLYVFGREKTFF